MNVSDYLDFVRQSVQTLIERQSARAGGRADGALCLTVTRQFSRSCRSMGGTKGNYYTVVIEEQPIEPAPYRLDLDAWPVLDLLSEVTGDGQYRDLVDGMSSMFGQHGFDPASGLGYLGSQAEFDVIHLQPVPVSSYTEPTFKPDPFLPLDRLWAVAQERMGRMFKSAFYGLITRPEDMSYNRYCSYGFDDKAKKPSMAFNSHHVAFEYTGATLIHWWGYLFAHTGDVESLAWAKAMADKWQAVQHPESGLIPAWFGSDRRDEPTQPPRPYMRASGTLVGISLLWAAQELRKRPEGAGLAEQVEGMAHRLLRGMARYGYDSKERIFPQWLNLDGSEREETTFYCFRTQAEKDEEVKRDPTLQEVGVYAGSGFYLDGPGAVGIHNRVPHEVALGAQMTGDAEALSASRKYAEDLMEAAGKLTGPLNAQGQWTYPASATYIKTLLLLRRMTGEQRYLDWAKKLADMEMSFLSGPAPAGEPEWWRLPFRDGLLEALLLLHQEAG